MLLFLEFVTILLTSVTLFDTKESNQVIKKPHQLSVNTVKEGVFMSIEIKELSKCFHSKDKKTQALSNVNLSINEGEILCVLGHNGAGKTTLIKSICGLLKPDSGCVSIDGKIVHQNLLYAHKNCGTVLEGSRNIYYYLTAYENLRYFGLLNGLTQTEINEFAIKYLTMFNLEEFKDVPANSFSRGMQQKVAIIIALMKNPKILLLDEPTLGLDIISSDSVISMLKQLAENEKRSIIITTHDIHLIEELNSRLVFMNHGKIILDSTLKELKHPERNSYYKLTMFGASELPYDAIVKERQNQIVVFETKDYEWIKNYLGTEELVQIEKHVPSVAEIYKEVMGGE